MWHHAVSFSVTEWKPWWNKEMSYYFKVHVWGRGGKVVKKHPWWILTLYDWSTNIFSTEVQSHIQLSATLAFCISSGAVDITYMWVWSNCYQTVCAEHFVPWDGSPTNSKIYLLYTVVPSSSSDRSLPAPIPTPLPRRSRRRTDGDWRYYCRMIPAGSGFDSRPFRAIAQFTFLHPWVSSYSRSNL